MLLVNVLSVKLIIQMLCLKLSLKAMYCDLKKTCEICVASEKGRSTCPLPPSKGMGEKVLKRRYLHSQDRGKIFMLKVCSHSLQTVTV